MIKNDINKLNIIKLINILYREIGVFETLYKDQPIELRLRLIDLLKGVFFIISDNKIDEHKIKINEHKIKEIFHLEDQNLQKMYQLKHLEDQICALEQKLFVYFIKLFRCLCLYLKYKYDIYEA